MATRQVVLLLLLAVYGGPGRVSGASLQTAGTGTNAALTVTLDDGVPVVAPTLPGVGLDDPKPAGTLTLDDAGDDNSTSLLGTDVTKTDVTKTDVTKTDDTKTDDVKDDKTDTGLTDDTDKATDDTAFDDGAAVNDQKATDDATDDTTDDTDDTAQTDQNDGLAGLFDVGDLTDDLGLDEMDINDFGDDINDALSLLGYDKDKGDDVTDDAGDQESDGDTDTEGENLYNILHSDDEKDDSNEDSDDDSAETDDDSAETDDAGDDDSGATTAAGGQSGWSYSDSDNDLFDIMSSGLNWDKSVQLGGDKAQLGHCPRMPVEIDDSKITVHTKKGCQMVIKLTDKAVTQVMTQSNGEVHLKKVLQETKVSFLKDIEDDSENDDNTPF